MKDSKVAYWNFPVRIYYFKSCRWFLLLLIFAACSPDSEEVEDRIDGTEYMAYLLDSIAEYSDPTQNYHMNLALAEIYKQEMEASNNPAERTMLFFQNSQELLNGGRAVTAIQQFETLVQSLESQGFELDERTKPYYEMLAIAYLRMGELQNCVENPTSYSCIVPLQPEGYHRARTGAENAIRVYERILNHFPDDFNSKWLLNVSYMELGKYPDQVPADWLVELTSPDSDDGFKFRDVASELGLNILGLSGGVAVDDFSGNGYHDIFMTSYGLRDQCRLFFNNGDGSFTDVTESAGLKGIVSGLNVIHADYNNSGYPDIFILRGGWLNPGGNHPNSLLRNNGDGTFSDVTKEAGLLSFKPTQTAAWADFDGDGYLDLYIGNETLPGSGVSYSNELYRNNGDGTFTNVAAHSGLDISGFTKGVVWGDINNNGLPDLYISQLGAPNLLFANRGGSHYNEWKFEEIAQIAGVQKPIHSFPAFFFDFDNDGYEDLLVFDYTTNKITELGSEFVRELRGESPTAETLRLYRNLGNEKFEDYTEKAGLEKALFTMGCNYGDLNNSGFPDFYSGTGAPDLRSTVPNRMFVNVDGRQFEEITHWGFGHIQKGHGIAFADFENNGQQDIYAVQGGAYEGDVAYNLLFKNPGNDNSWIHLILEGEKSNRSAIGARVAIHTLDDEGKEKTFFKRVNTGGTFGSGPLRVESGLGNAREIEKIVVHWPKPGETEVYESPPINRILKIKEGERDYKDVTETVIVSGAN